jgi:hypothetical protein
MQRILFGVLLAAAGHGAAHAQQPAAEVYQWQDANGVTHFSQTPPATGAYQQRAITDTGSAAPVAQASTTAAAAAESSQCTTARSNIEALQGDTAVQQDTDGDGKPDKVLDAAERAAQLEFAQAAVKAFCAS